MRYCINFLKISRDKYKIKFVKNETILNFNCFYSPIVKLNLKNLVTKPIISICNRIRNKMQFQVANGDETPNLANYKYTCLFRELCGEI